MSEPDLYVICYAGGDGTTFGTRYLVVEEVVDQGARVRYTSDIHEATAFDRRRARAIAAECRVNGLKGVPVPAPSQRIVKCPEPSEPLESLSCSSARPGKKRSFLRPTSTQ